MKKITLSYIFSNLDRIRKELEAEFISGEKIKRIKNELIQLDTDVSNLKENSTLSTNIAKITALVSIIFCLASILDLTNSRQFGADTLHVLFFLLVSVSSIVFISSKDALIHKMYVELEELNEALIVVSKKYERKQKWPKLLKAQTSLSF